MKELDDHSPMPFGKYKGEPMGQVPADYLLYLYDGTLKPGPVRTYIVENLDALRVEAQRESDSREILRSMYR